jgi:drug/metabolite transporter (DMT)-like permease
MLHTFLIVLVTIIWGSTFFIIKDTVANVNEFFIVFGRSLIATVAMLIYVLKKHPRVLLNKGSIIYGSIIGTILGITYISQTIGLKFTSSGHSAFITGAAVIFVPLLLFILYREKLTLIRISAFLIVFFGLFLLTYDFETTINKGDLITSITTISLAFHIILSARYVNKTEVLGLVFYQFLAATIVSFIGFIITSEGNIDISQKSFFAILYLGFFGTLFCYFVTVWVLKYVSPLKVSIIFSLEPVFAALFAFAFASEILNIKEIIGTIFILAGIIFYQILEKIRKQKLLLQK